MLVSDTYTISSKIEDCIILQERQIGKKYPRHALYPLLVWFEGNKHGNCLFTAMHIRIML